MAIFDVMNIYMTMYISYKNKYCKGFSQEITAQQSAHVEPVSGTSAIGYKRLPPTISQQDQSAKKKPKKSNNENEGDVPTILQNSLLKLIIMKNMAAFDLMNIDMTM
jgi:hypothetical protein